jgi:hypothetical protein
MLWDLTSTDLVLIIITMQLAEQEEIRRMRREMVPRAQLMPYFDRPFVPQRYSSEPCACLNILGLCMTGQKFVGICMQQNVSAFVGLLISHICTIMIMPDHQSD